MAQVQAEVLVPARAAELAWDMVPVWAPAAEAESAEVFTKLVEVFPLPRPSQLPILNIPKRRAGTRRKVLVFCGSLSTLMAALATFELSAASASDWTPRRSMR